MVTDLAERRERVEIYFQLDSLDDSQTEILRGQAGLVERKLRALDRLAAAGMSRDARMVEAAAGGRCGHKH